MPKPLHRLACAALAACIAMPWCAQSAFAASHEGQSGFSSAARTLRGELAPSLPTFAKLEATRSANSTDIASARVQGLQDVMYDGTAKTPTVTLKLGELTLREGRDFTVTFAGDTVNPGVVGVAIAGTGAYTGTLDTSFSIVPGDLTQATVDVIADQALDAEGTPIEPLPTVRLNGNELEQGMDYTAEYANNAAEGTATVIVFGMGNCAGETHATFEIIEEPAAAGNTTIGKIAQAAGTFAPALAALAGLGALGVLFARRKLRARRVGLSAEEG